MPNRKTVHQIVKHGKYYNPARNHNDKPTNCYNCKINDINVCIGYDKYDICMECASKFTQKTLEQKKSSEFKFSYESGQIKPKSTHSKDNNDWKDHTYVDSKNEGFGSISCNGIDWKCNEVDDNKSQSIFYKDFRVENDVLGRKDENKFTWDN
jgi:hypothetical protein